MIQPTREQMELFDKLEKSTKKEEIQEINQRLVEIGNKQRKGWLFSSAKTK